MTHQLTADPVKLKGKPNKEQVGLIKRRMKRASVDSVRGFVESIGAGIS